MAKMRKSVGVFARIKCSAFATQHQIWGTFWAGFWEGLGCILGGFWSHVGVKSRPKRMLKASSFSRRVLKPENADLRPKKPILLGSAAWR